jgi:heme exporter protein A
MPIAPSYLLEAKKITCIREQRILFEDLDFTITSGEIIQVEGPNGAGKTSLLRILAGLSSPYEGKVYFNNQGIDKDTELYNNHLLYIGHLPGIKGEMNVAENLHFNAQLHNVNTNDIDTMLTEVDLFGFEDSLTSHLSAGQQRRIALAQLWQTTAPIWILDEPFMALDKLGVSQLEHRIVDHTTQGGCVILTTHQDLNISASLIKKLTLDYRLF